MDVKSLTARIFLNLWLLMSLTFLLVPSVHAQEETPSGGGSAGPISCQDLNNGEATKGWVISIIEEQFGNDQTAGTLPPDANSFTMLCARKTGPAGTCAGDESSTSEGTAQEGQDQTEKIGSCYVSISECSPSDKIICQSVRVFGSKSGLGLLFTYIGLIYRWAAGVIGIVAVFYIVYGGIKISTAGDNTAAVDEAKTKIIQAIAGLVLLFISAVVLYTINPNFFTL